ncbi:hypothetical protein KDD30_02750 [Photobacterium sp. GJ3]|uniref:PilW family protein n=1 Tax=Photobacterium sp. GJ3 TaxID=2829502 RepID=UPI001B8D2AFF|nr:hypothetical protein [Photobacterium sp. GJ3]QUJ68087.1 hypothetical protein KDD30_02750 [Photobacterium sp. GJ3]
MQPVSAPRSGRAEAGFSLMEMTVASALSLMVLSLLIHLLVAGKQAALSQTRALVLAQDVQDIWRMLSGDIRRAGYRSDSAQRAAHRSQEPVVYVSAGDCVVLHYELADTRVTKAYYRDDDVLRLRSTTVSFPVPEMACQGGQSLLDSRWMRVTDWQVRSEWIERDGRGVQHLTLSLAVTAQDGSVTHRERMTLRVRNS